MIYLTGDTHGDYDFAKLEVLKARGLSNEDYLLILGDCGVVWNEADLASNIALYESLGCVIIFIDGNHENFKLLNTFEVVTYLGAKMHKISPCIYHVLRGEIFTLDDKTFFCLGGARSTDRAYRKKDVSYWIEEEITSQDIVHAKEELTKVNYSVDYVLTHCVDSLTVFLYLHMNNDSSTYKLNFIDEEVNYKHWYFGHYHKDLQISSKKTCVYQNIYQLKEDFEIIL